MSPTDTHIKFSGIDGESTHKDHTGEMEVLSWQWETLNDSGGSGGGAGKGKAVPGKFFFTHLYDKGSPVLAKYCASGKHFLEVKVTSRKAGEGQKAFLVITFKEVFINSVQPAGSAGGAIVEGVRFSYKQIDFAYKAQDGNGGLTGEVKFGWNTATTEVT
jgi:type VI secretion system secreted protein Hcp